MYEAEGSVLDVLDHVISLPVRFKPEVMFKKHDKLWNASLSLVIELLIRCEDFYVRTLGMLSRLSLLIRPEEFVCISEVVLILKSLEQVCIFIEHFFKSLCLAIVSSFSADNKSRHLSSLILAFKKLFEV